MPLPLWAGMALGGAALGLAKNEFIDKPRAERMAKAEAAKTAYSPWTGMQGRTVMSPSGADAALKWGATGALLGAGMPAGAAGGGAGASVSGAGAGAAAKGAAAAKGGSAMSATNAAGATAMGSDQMMNWSGMQANQMSPTSSSQMMGTNPQRGAYGYNDPYLYGGMNPNTY
jgi:hypothetical protein